MKAAHAKTFLLLTILSYGVGNAQSTKNNVNNQTMETPTAVQTNKEVIQKIYEQALNKRNMALLTDLISEDYTGIKGKKGPSAFYEPLTVLITAFPDIQWKLQELVGEGDKVAVTWKWQGTQTAPYLQLVTTGKTITNDGMAVFVLKNGKVVSSQVLTDRLGFLQQLEALPADVNTLSNRKPQKDQVSFIDKFIVPEKAKQEFTERMAINRAFVKSLPGFVEDNAYERTDENGNTLYVTVAVWENEEAVKNAKDKVQAEYKRQGFDMHAMLERLGVVLDRGLYKSMSN